jgi:cytochrome o ubiquinol oxidase subunit I
MPRPSALGFFVAFFAFVGGFALVWHIWWLALVGLGGLVASGLARAWQLEHEFEVDPSEIAAFEAQGVRA